MLLGGQDEVAPRRDDVMEVERRSVLGIIGPERLGLRPARIQDREHMRDTTCTVILQRVQAVDGHQRDGGWGDDPPCRLMAVCGDHGLGEPLP